MSYQPRLSQASLRALALALAMREIRHCPDLFTFRDRSEIESEAMRLGAEPFNAARYLKLQVHLAGGPAPDPPP